MAYYINSAASFDTLGKEVKELIPVPEMRRRMSRAVRMGVATGMEVLGGLPAGVEVGAIITATRLGCLADSEKFLRGVIEGPEGLLNPTPFIQSTFNTVGAQIALLTRNHCYNMTWVHGEGSLGCALMDAAIRLDQAAAGHVLVGLFDESTPSLEAIKRRFGGREGLPTRDGAWFFVVSSHPLEGCLGEVETLNERSVMKWLRR